MAWTDLTRGEYERCSSGYPSDLTDDEWALVRRFMPARRAAGRPRTTSMRAVVDAIFYMLSTGCQWRALPHDFPPRATVQRYFYRWRDQQLWRRLARIFARRERRRCGRASAPSACVIDSQSVKTTECGGPRGFDAAKRVKGRKRHIIVDTAGRLLEAHIHPANIQDNHGAGPLLTALGEDFPKLRHVFADRVYRGDRLLNAVAETGPWTIDIITRIASTGRFTPEPKRWVVERTFAWFGRNRRLAKDFERSIASAEAWFWLASVKLMTRRLAKWKTK